MPTKYHYSADLYGPIGVAVDATGRVFVADGALNWVVIWELVAGVWTNVANFGTGGSGAQNLDRPEDVAVAADGRVYVADSGNSRISVWREHGGTWNNVSTFGKPGGTIENVPVGVAFDQNGRLYVTTQQNPAAVTIWCSV